MIYIIVNNEQFKNEIKEVISKKHIDENQILFSLPTNNRKLNNRDIVICDYVDIKSKKIIDNANIIMYKPMKTSKIFIEQSKFADICRTKEELSDKIEYIMKKNNYIKKINNSMYITLALLIIILSLIIIYMFNLNKPTNTNKKPMKEVEKEKPIDFKRENIVLYGDSITDFYDVEKYFGTLPVVNSGISGNGVDNLYGEIKERIYVYNPTKVFIMIGTNDISHKDDQYIYDKIRDIIKLINENRPAAEVYLESLYPVNRNTGNGIVIDWMVGSRTNERIKGLNTKLSTLCKNESVKCKYVNMYDELLDEKGDLKLAYTKDGLHLTDEGYKVVTNKLMSYIDPNLTKKVEKK